MNGKEGTNFERELPAGYREEFVIDAKDKKTAVWLSVGSFVLTAAVFVILFRLIKPSGNFTDGFISRYLIVLGTALIYIVCHELVHGAAYKLMTGEKLTYGFSLTVAYCGVPNIYVYRKTALISLLAPFTVFNIVFGLAVILVRDPWDKVAAAVLLALHIGGCIGDLYVTSLYLGRFRDPATLMRDTGPRQSFYLPGTAEEETEEYE